MTYRNTIRSLVLIIFICLISLQHGIGQKNILHNRGLAVVPLSDYRVFISWRMLKQDMNSAYSVQRSIEKNGEYIEIAKIGYATNYIDSILENLDSTYWYKVLPVGGDLVNKIPQKVSVKPNKEGQDYFVLFDAPGLVGNHQGWGDTDGDGKLEVISRRKFQDTYWINVQEIGDTSAKWQMDFPMGRPVTGGPEDWNQPIIVGDFDGDSIDEIIAGCMRDSNNVFILLEDQGNKYSEKYQWPWPDSWENMDDDHRVMVFSGRFGNNALGFGAVYSTKHNAYQWEIRTYEWQDNSMTEIWKFDYQDGGNSRGSHRAHTADLDHDGLEEVIYGSSVIDHDGEEMWNGNKVIGINNHIDRVVIDDIIYTNSGSEVALCNEDGSNFAIFDGISGKLLLERQLEPHVNAIHIADITDVPGLDILATTGSHKYDDSDRDLWMFSADGNNHPWPFSENDIPHGGSRIQSIDWDGDLLREFWIGAFDYNKDYEKDERRAKIYGRGGKTIKQVNNPEIGSLKKSSRGIDIIGDYREEIIGYMYNGEVRAYINTDTISTKKISRLQHFNYLNAINGAETSTHFGLFDYLGVDDSILAAPLPAQQFEAYAYEHIKAKLTWLDVSNTEEGYNVYCKNVESDTSYQLIYTTNKNTEEVIIDNSIVQFDSCGVYNFYVRALNPNGESGISNIDAIRFRACQLTDQKPAPFDDENFFQVYPQPANDLLFVELTLQRTKPASIDLFNCYGAKVGQFNINLQSKYSLDVSRLIPGVYFLICTQKNGITLTRKVLVK